MFGIADCAKDTNTRYSVNMQMGTNLVCYIHLCKGRKHKVLCMVSTGHKIVK